MLSVTYREVKSRFDEQQLLALSDYCAESGLSQSEVIRRAVAQYIGTTPVTNQSINSNEVDPDAPVDPSNPLA